MACDEMTAELLNENKKAVQDGPVHHRDGLARWVFSELISICPCRFIPALDTLFIGMEKSPGHFFEACAQCGQCILGETAGICPLTSLSQRVIKWPLWRGYR